MTCVVAGGIHSAALDKCGYFLDPVLYVAKYFLSGREQSILGDVALMEDWVTLRRRVTDTFTGNVV